MGLFNKKKKSEEPQRAPVPQNTAAPAGEEKEQEITPGCFTGFVLLESPRWDKEAVLAALAGTWGVTPEPPEEGEKEEPDMAVFQVGPSLVAISLVPAKVPDGEAEHYAAANYLWPEAVEVTASHQAHLIVAVLGRDASPVDSGRLFVKAAASCLAQPGALGIYTSGTVLSPDHFLTVAEAMKDGELPVMDWVYIGLYRSETGSGAYTYGLTAFGKDELEILDSPHAPGELHEFLFDICYYLLEGDVTLRDGETIGFTEDQKLSITRSKGVAVDGMSLKIGY